VILQITNKDTLDSLSNISDSNFNYGLLIFLGIIAIGLILLIYYSRRKSKQDVINNLAGNKKSILVESIITSKVNDSTKKTQSANEIKPDIGNSEIKTLKKDEQVKREFKSETKGSNDYSSIKVIEPVKPEKEEQSKEKYIGYNPINIFAQTEPFNYPYVIMPKPNSVIKFPRKGRIGRKGFKEEDFKKYIEKYFKESFQVFDDRFILVKNNPKPFEPDFTLIDEKNNINIFLDIEIDEPYEGLNDISKRRPTHYQQFDTNRNNAFKNRGWIVIRFAEIQVHQKPNSCCRFIADVLKSINPKYVVPASLSNIERLNPIRQWTKEEAENWSLERYREKYLGIDNFGQTLTSDDLSNIEETEIGEKIEDIVEDDKFIPIEAKYSNTNSKLDKIYSAINSGKYLSFKFKNEQSVVKPIKVSDDKLFAFCYVKNRDRDFSLYQINDLCLKDSYYTLRVAGPTIGLDQITQAVNTAIVYHKLIRMKYTRSSWTNMIVDRETGELLIDRIEAEESVRTINDVQLSINALAQEHIEAYNLNSNYITAYCNKREEQRTFRFDRIGEIEILNI
jgi:hypothetical protein